MESDGRTRTLVVTEVDEGRGMGFTWWDDADPEVVSTVELAVEADGDGTTLTVTETVPTGGLGLAATFVAEASVASLAAVADSWGPRLGQLRGVLAPALVGA